MSHAARGWVAAAALALLAGCHREAPPAGPSEGTPALRLVVVAPALAETVVALGLGERIVGVGDFVTYPQSLADRPRVGAYDTPDAEALLALGATHLLTSASEAARPAHERLSALGIEVVAPETGRYAGALAAIRQLGERLGRQRAAEALAQAIAARVEAVRGRAADLPRRRVLLAVGSDPLYAAGPGSFLDELLAAAGGENLFADAAAPYLLASLESLLARRPEVIVDCSDNRRGAPRGARAGAWRRWPLLPAVAGERVYLVDPLRLAIPGPRLGEIAELLAKLVHPERFGRASEAELSAPAGEEAGA